MFGVSLRTNETIESQAFPAPCALEAGGAPSACLTAAAAKGRAKAGAGIYGQIVNAWGNPPAALDARSGTFAQFRVPLVPGRQVVESGGHWESTGGEVRFVADRHHVTVLPGRWINLSTALPPNPAP